MASQSTKYHLLHYQYAPDILEKRGPHRDAHIGAARQQVQSCSLHLSICHAFVSVSARLVVVALLSGINCMFYKPGMANCLYIAQADAGKMLIAGAAGDPVDSALFIWQDVSKQVNYFAHIRRLPEALS